MAMAKAAMESMALERMLIMPAGDPPHKLEGIASKEERMRMVELACKGTPFEPSALEIQREGKTYTVDTLKALSAQHPGASIVMLIGADTLREISGWRHAEQVFSLCTFAVFARDGLSLPEVPGARIVHMDAVIPDISSTVVRARIERGDSLDGYVPQAVIDYIGKKRLYNPPKRMPGRAMRDRLARTLPQRRYQHSLGVEQTMRMLAMRFGYNSEQAALAGLLHDCAKGMTLLEMQEVVEAAGMHVSADRLGSRELLHAPASAQLAKSIYGVTDPEVLRAIFYHNTGCVPMESLDKLLCVADMTEPNRRLNAEIASLRAVAGRDLDEAVCMTLRLKIEHVKRLGKWLHPETERALSAMEP